MTPTAIRPPRRQESGPEGGPEHDTPRVTRPEDQASEEGAWPRRVVQTPHGQAPSIKD